MGRQLSVSISHVIKIMSEKSKIVGVREGPRRMCDVSRRRGSCEGWDALGLDDGAGDISEVRLLGLGGRPVVGASAEEGLEVHALEDGVGGGAHGDASEVDDRLAVDVQRDLAVVLAGVVERDVLRDGDPLARGERVRAAADADAVLRVADGALDFELGLLVRGREREVGVDLALAFRAPHETRVEAVTAVILTSARAAERGRSNTANYTIKAITIVRNLKFRRNSMTGRIEGRQE